MKTKQEEAKEQAIRAELEELTRKEVKLQDEFDKICVKIEKLPTSRLVELKWLCNKKQEIFTNLQFIRSEKNKRIHLINTL